VRQRQRQRTDAGVQSRVQGTEEAPVQREQAVQGEVSNDECVVN